jgi:PKD repeat protein
MRNALTLVLLLLLAVSAGAAEDKFVAVDRPLDLPSFVGWAEDEIVVVLKSDVTVDHARDKKSERALSNYPGFAPLAQRFEVIKSRPQFADADRKAGGEFLARHYKVKISRGTVEEAKAAFERNPLVDRVERIGLHTMHATPNDTYYDNPPPSFPYDQWHYWDTKGIDADQAWDSNSGDATVVVGILDSGTRYFHIDLGGNSPIWGPDNPFSGGNIFINPGETAGDAVDNDGNGYVDDVIGWDFVETTGGFGVSCIDQDCGGADNDPDDGDGHGSHVSGTVGAITNNARSVAGVAGGFSDGTTSGIGNGVKILPCRIGYHARYRGITTGIVNMAAAAEAMYYVADLVDAGHNVAAINCSWGSSNSGGLGAAADFLLSRDVVIVVAAGNSGSSSADYLNSRGDCLDVAATDRNGDGASFSNHGSWVDVAAPGVDIMSTYANPDDPDLNNHYVALLDGTSMSAPHVAGIVGLLESCSSSLTGPQKFNLVVNNTIPYTDTRDLGSGIANAYLALNAASCAICTETTPVANFSGSPTSGDAPLTVNFTDLSTNNPTSWSWTFGDGGSSTDQNPSYQYTSPGTYTVTLTASNCAGSDLATQIDYITVTSPPCTETTPVADFSGTPLSGDAPLTVNFTDLSTDSPSSWSWTFGDGGSSTAQNPSYEYTSAGTFTVTLISSNCAGADTASKVDYVTVTQPAGDVMHIHDIQVTRQSKGPNWSGVGAITIYNQSEQPVANATVSVVATGPTGGSGSGLTNSNGVVVFETSKIKNPSGEWCFEVTNVTHATNSYNSGDNHVTKACESGPVFKYETGAPGLPNDFVLHQNYPNPFNPATRIAFSLPQASHVTLEVFDISGRKVATLADGIFSTGEHTLEWDASAHASGVYLYRIVTDGYAESRKMILLK